MKFIGGILCLLLIYAVPANATTRFSGYIVKSDGQTVWADEIRSSQGDEWNVRVVFEGQPVSSSIQKQEIVRLMITERDECSPKKAVVKLSDGRSFELVGVSFYGLFDIRDKRLYFDKFDPISRELKVNSLSCEQILEVRLDSEKGNLKLDSSRNSFPPDFLFSPYTGEKLKFGNFPAKK